MSKWTVQWRTYPGGTRTLWVSQPIEFDTVAEAREWLRSYAARHPSEDMAAWRVRRVVA